MEWITQIISVVSLVISLLSLFLSWQNEKRKKNFDELQNNFNLWKEKVRQQGEAQNLFIQKLNHRSGLVPHFQLSLDDSDITFKTNTIILKINIINIGKESATNIGLHLIKKEIGVKNKYLYDIHSYLNQYYAFVKDKISFSFTVKIQNNVDNNIILDFFQFKITYKDLIGNLYEQHFEVGYDNYLLKGYNLNHTSFPPQLISESTVKQ